MFDDGGDRHWAASVDIGRNIGQLGECLLRHLLDKDVQNSATGQADGERIVVADAVALEYGVAVCYHLLREGIDRRLHTTTRYRSHRGVIGTNQHGGAGLSRCRTPGANHSAHTDRLASPPPCQQVREDVTHRYAPQASARTSRSSANVASECPATIRSR